MTVYDYAAAVVRVIDGDTVVLDIDLGFNITIRETVRLNGINAPELHASDPAVKAAAIAARDYLTTLLLNAGNVALAHTDKPYHGDKYGRMLAILYISPGNLNVNQNMIDTGHAVPYDGS